MFEDTFDNIMGFFPDEILGLPKMAFFGLLIGILIACNEGIFKKYNKYKMKVGDKEITFNKKYLMSGIVAIAVTFVTVYLVMDGGLINDSTTFAMALTIGFTEGGLTIKYLNTRLDMLIEKQAKKGGATEEQAEEIAKAVEFVEVKQEATSINTSFEEL